jgi:hypothetical protein
VSGTTAIAELYDVPVQTPSVSGEVGNKQQSVDSLVHEQLEIMPTASFMDGIDAFRVVDVLD